MPVNPVLSNRALMLAKIETTYNVDSLPSAVSDSFLVMNADLKIDPNVLRRNFYKPSLSQLPIFVGRKLASCSFTHEVKGSGAAATVPKLGTLLRACGFLQSSVANTASATIGTAIPATTNTGPTVTWAKTTAPTSVFGRFKVKVVLGGASATAKVMVFGNPPGGDPTIFPADDFSAVVMSKDNVPATTTITVNTTNPLAPTFTIATPQIGDIIVFSVYGVRFKYTVGSAVANTEATAIAALLVDPAVVDRWTAGAATGTVTVTVTGALGITLTSATTGVNLGTAGGVITPTWSGALVIGDYWTVDTIRPGFHYTPVSSVFESATIYMYYDGILHRLTGCIGTVQFTMEAGQYATAQFTFTGQYNNPDDSPMPSTSVFEPTSPVQVELAQFQVGNLRNLCAQSFSIDMGIQVNPRDCVSGSDGYNGVMYTSREPKGTANPEMEFEATEPYWRNMSAGNVVEFYGRVGTAANNRVEFISHSIQISNISYADRNNLRTYDMSYEFVTATSAGDDELRIAFT